MHISHSQWSQTCWPFLIRLACCSTGFLLPFPQSCLCQRGLHPACMALFILLHNLFGLASRLVYFVTFVYLLKWRLFRCWVPEALVVFCIITFYEWPGLSCQSLSCSRISCFVWKGEIENSSGLPTLPRYPFSLPLCLPVYWIFLPANPQSQSWTLPFLSGRAFLSSSLPTSFPSAPQLGIPISPSPPTSLPFVSYFGLLPSFSWVF